MKISAEPPICAKLSIRTLRQRRMPDRSVIATGNSATPSVCTGGIGSFLGMYFNAPGD